MTRQQRMQNILQNELAPTLLKITNDSASHLGHAGFAPENNPNHMQTHFTIEIKAQALENLTKVKAHQIIYKLLDDEFKSGLHALSIKIA